MMCGIGRFGGHGAPKDEVRRRMTIAGEVGKRPEVTGTAIVRRGSDSQDASAIRMLEETPGSGGPAGGSARGGTRLLRRGAVQVAQRAGHHSDRVEVGVEVGLAYAVDPPECVGGHPALVDQAVQRAGGDAEVASRGRGPEPVTPCVDGRVLHHDVEDML